MQIDDVHLYLLQSIGYSKELISRVRICINAYFLIQNAEPQDQSELISFFFRKADKAWSRDDEDLSSDITHLLDETDQISSEYFERANGFEWNNTYSRRKSIDNLPDIQDLTIEDISYCDVKYRQLVEGVIDLYSNEGYSESDYYSHFWNMFNYVLNQLPVKEKGICFYFALCDNRTPYYQVSKGLIMSDEEYEKKIRENIIPVEKMWYVLNLKTRQKTEKASQLYAIIESLETKEQRIIFLTQLMDILSN